MSQKLDRDEVIVSEHLAELRGQVRLLTWVSGLSWTMLVLLGGMLVTGLLDWMIHFDDPGLRLVIGVGLLSASSVMAWRQLIRPLIQPMTASFLALRIEGRFPGLHGRVLSAVEFLQHRLDPRIGSPELQKSVVGDALRDLERIQPSDIVETRTVKRITIAGAMLCAMIATVVILHPLEAATSVKRLMFPFAECPWPRQFELMLVERNFEPVIQAPDRPRMIARGDTLELYVVSRRGRLPERVWFEHRLGDDPQLQREPLRQTTLRDETGRSHEAAVISWVASRGPLQIRATGGDDDTMPFIKVEVVQPPTLQSLRVTVTPPKYSGRPAETLPQGVGHVQGLLGTQITVEAAADKPLKSARVRIADKPAIALNIGEDRMSFTAAFPIVDPGVTGYWFELSDDAGFSDPEAPRFELRGIADAVPEVLIEEPVADVLLAPDAELLVKVLAKDDLGLRDVRISYQIDTDPTAKLIPLVTSANGADTPQLLSTSDYLWKLSDLALQPGSRIVFRAEATDAFDLGPEPHVGKSTPRTITIVSRIDKQKELAGRVGDLLEDLQQASALQQRARQQTHELQMQLNSTGELRTQDVDQLHRIELDQRQTVSRLNRPADGVQSQARQLEEEFRANKLEDAEMQQRLNQITDELSRLSRDQFPEIESALTRATKQAEDSGRTESTEDKTPPDQKPDSENPSKTDPTTKESEPKKGDPAKTRSLDNALSEAHGQQSQVMETLQELQDLLSKWRDQRDVSKELNALIGEQEKIQKESADLGQQTVSKSGMELSAQEKADLGKMAERQRKMAEQVEQFRKQLQQASEGLQERDPDAAERFDEAREELTTDGTASKLREAAQDIADNQIGNASQNQQQALDDLRDLDKQLKRQPTDDVETLIKQIDQVMQEFETLRKEQTELQEQMQKASGQPNTPQKKDEIEKLRERQQDLGERLAQAERKLERLRLRQPTEAAERAQERLNRVNEKLQEPEQADDVAEEMQQIVDDLEQVERDLAIEKRSAQERLAIEELEKIEDLLKALVAQQQGVITETERLEAERAERGSFTRGQLRTLKDLADVERGLQNDAEQMEKSLKVAEVFSLVLRRTSRHLKIAADRLAERQTDGATVAMEKAALKKIESLLLVLQPDAPSKTENAQAPPPGSDPEDPQEKPEQAGPPGESLPQLAQLKLLKSLQEEFHERTQSLDELRDADGKLPPEAEAELQELAKEQSELADLTRNLVAHILRSRPDKEDAQKDSSKSNDPDAADEKRRDASELDLLDEKPARERKEK